MYIRFHRLTSLSVGLQGIRASDVDMVEEKIMQVFREAREMTFEQKKIDAILHQIEISRKHVCLYKHEIYNLSDSMCIEKCQVWLAFIFGTFAWIVARR